MDDGRKNDDRDLCQNGEEQAKQGAVPCGYFVKTCVFQVTFKHET